MSLLMATLRYSLRCHLWPCCEVVSERGGVSPFLQFCGSPAGCCLVCLMVAIRPVSRTDARCAVVWCRSCLWQLPTSFRTCQALCWTGWKSSSCRATRLKRNATLQRYHPVCNIQPSYSLSHIKQMTTPTVRHCTVYVPGMCIIHLMWCILSYKAVSGFTLFKLPVALACVGLDNQKAVRCDITPGLMGVCDAVHVQRHLIPGLLAEHGLTSDQLVFPSETVTLLADGYTREVSSNRPALPT